MRTAHDRDQLKIAGRFQAHHCIGDFSTAAVHAKEISNGGDIGRIRDKTKSVTAAVCCIQ